MFIVTGAAGFIGSCLISALNEKYPTTPVVAVDWMGQDQRWKNLNKRVMADIVAPEDLFDWLEGHEKEVKAIFHMGAISATDVTDVDDLMAKNTSYTMELFNWCADFGVQFIYASSASTYGDGKHDFNDNDSLEYLKKLEPLNAYGFSKHTADKAIVTAKTTPPQWVGLKFFNVYGPNEYHKGGQASVVLHAFNQISANGQVNLFKSHNPKYKDGGQMRDFVSVKDACKVMLWFAENPKVSGLFNVGSGQARTFKDLVSATFNAMGQKDKIKYIPTPEHLREHYQYYTQANMDKFQQVVKKYDKKHAPFKFTVLEDGVKDYVQNYLMQDKQTW